jgi:hypothetical protein
MEGPAELGAILVQTLLTCIVAHEIPLVLLVLATHADAQMVVMAQCTNDGHSRSDLHKHQIHALPLFRIGNGHKFVRETVFSHYVIRCS